MLRVLRTIEKDAHFSFPKRKRDRFLSPDRRPPLPGHNTFRILRIRSLHGFGTGLPPDPHDEVADSQPNSLIDLT